MKISGHDLPDDIRSKTQYLEHGNFLSKKHQWWNWDLHNTLSSQHIAKYRHEIDAGSSMKYTTCTTLTDGNCCCISPGFMIQVKYLASVLSPVCCCQTGDLEDTQKISWQMPPADTFINIFQEFILGLRQTWGLKSQLNVCVIQYFLYSTSQLKYKNGKSTCAYHLLFVIKPGRHISYLVINLFSLLEAAGRRRASGPPPAHWYRAAWQWGTELLQTPHWDLHVSISGKTVLQEQKPTMMAAKMESSRPHRQKTAISL